MIRILLATEGGRGRGHVLNLRDFVISLGPSFSFDAALHYMAVSHVLEDVCDAVFQGPSLVYDKSAREQPDGVRTATWGEFLGDLGFRNQAFLTAQIKWWRELFQSRQIDLVVSDFAPCAHLAARTLGLQAITTGTGYAIPGDNLKEFPILLPENAVRIYDERQMLDCVNATIDQFGHAPLASLTEIYDGADKLVRTMPFLDHADGTRMKPVINPLSEISNFVANEGTELFVYLSEINDDSMVLIDAICQLKIPIRTHIPRLSSSLAERLVKSGVIVEDAPIPLELIASRSRLILCNGAHGVLCMAASLGLPLVCVPQHLEHVFHSRKAEDLGFALTLKDQDMDVSTICKTIMTVYGDPSFSRASRACAIGNGEMFKSDFHKDIRERLRPILVKIVKQKGLVS